MNLNTYKTIMIGHMLANLYGALMEAKLNNNMDT